jgi:restriction system protein
MLFLRQIEGWFGEKCIATSLFLGLGQDYIRFNNLIIPGADGTTQIDHVILSTHGIFVVETKNYHGWISGTADDATWLAKHPLRTNTFQNPLRQNYRHIKALMAFLDLPEECFISIVYFVGCCYFTNTLPNNVINKGIIDYIQSFNQPKLIPQDVNESSRRLFNLQLHPITFKEHLNSLEERHTRTEKCPSCGHNLIIRQNKLGGTFVGCTGYPRCHYSRKGTLQNQA